MWGVTIMNRTKNNKIKESVDDKSAEENPDNITVVWACYARKDETYVGRMIIELDIYDTRNRRRQRRRWIDST